MTEAARQFPSKAETNQDPNAVTQLRRQSRTVREDLRKLGALARGAASESLQGVRTAAADYYAQGRDRVVQAERQVSTHVRRRPWRSLAIAGGLGALASMLLFRK